MSTTAHEDQFWNEPGTARSGLEEARAKCEGAAKPRTATQPAQTSGQGTGMQGTGMKYDAGKLQAGILFEDFPRALEAVLQVATFGANKYARSSWTAVPDAAQRYEDAMYRHLLAAGIEGLDALDAESGLLHRAHAAWNALATLELHLRKQVERAQREAVLTELTQQAEDMGMYSTAESAPTPPVQAPAVQGALAPTLQLKDNALVSFRTGSGVHYNLHFARKSGTTRGCFWLQYGSDTAEAVTWLTPLDGVEIPEGARYAALDCNGKLYLYDVKPTWSSSKCCHQYGKGMRRTYSAIGRYEPGLSAEIASNLLLEIASYELSEGAS